METVQNAQIREALENLSVLQSMISLSAERLDGLRTQCATTAEITQQEIRTLEGKLIKLFSNHLVAKRKIPESWIPPNYPGLPSLQTWLQVVGLNKKLQKGLCNKVSSLESLKERSEHEIRALLVENHANEEETRRLTRAMHNLKRYTEVFRVQGEPNGSISGNHVADMADLYWDSWDMNKLPALETASPRMPRTRTGRNSVPSEEYLLGGSGTCLTYHSASGNGVSNHQYHHHHHNLHTTCSTTPCTPVTTMAPSSLTSPAFSPGSHPNIFSPTHHNNSVFSPSAATFPSTFDPGLTPPSTPPVKGKDKKFPTTPPARKKHQAAAAAQAQHAATLQPDSFPLTKSKSHESQLANRIDTSASESNLTSLEQLPSKRRDRLPTEPGPIPTPTWDASASVVSCTPGVGGYASSSGSSPIKSPPSNSHSEVDEIDHAHRAATLQVPKSPRTPTLARSMGHMISHRFTKMFKVATCDYCFKQMILGVKCKECKFKCHRDCEPKVPPSCGLPPEYIDVFVKSLQDGDSPIPNRNSPLNWGRRVNHRKITRPPPNVHIQPFPVSLNGQDSSSNTSSCNSSTPSSPALFPATSTATPASASVSTHLFSFPDVSANSMGDISLDSRPLIGSTSSDMTSTEKSNDSDRTVSQTSGSGSTDSEKTLALRVDSQDSQISDGEPERNWPRQNSLSNREWDIPFDELKIGDKIGTGHFGTVYRGNWHGDVAIKLLDMTYLDNEKTLEQFKQEVAIFRKTRHENLVLFMGACMKPPRLAIVTSMCKGLTLYTHLHLRKDKFNMNKTVLVAQQISQGMGYLHARGIIHKDLKSKNIFLESGKVVITDFGLFSVTKLCHGSRNGDALSIPPGWLCYLAPEVMKSLSPSQKHDSELPFSKGSDIYAFGTVWYELLCGEWPYKGFPPESIIWQVGNGIRQPLPTLFSRDIKEIMMMCWSAKPDDRPDFSRLIKSLEKLPKKRLARSPSHPIHLSRSAESVF